MPYPSRLATDHLYMYRYFVFVLILLIGCRSMSNSAHAPVTAAEDVARIVFLGNSITYNGQYIKAIETYYRYHFPNRNIEFINVGLSSETVSGLSEPGHADGAFPRPVLQERLDRVLALTKPDLVLACYGMNGGIYLPLDESRFRKFREGILHLRRKVRDSGASIVHLTPPVYDENKGGKQGYDKVLEHYGEWLLRTGKEKNWEVVDIHEPMKAFLAAQQESDPEYSFSPDGVHPDRTGHWLMAREILLYLGHGGVAETTGIKEALGGRPNVDQVIQLVEARQNLMRDAWLSATGHNRPGVKAGLPLEQAKRKAAELDVQIQALLK